ncbi:MAG: D-tyrosyl-tRNA(Tyr) deacylase [Magnetococcales bacterium]|nr:D-tyrosyl-tRNA(Tyr) deacylase [Magnetococcales bacterium]MBF0321722.1 D-tyrosyl-tRNA(Tyr) deacylase [Magnetococcales bacterium]
MRILVQRVARAAVRVSGAEVARIDQGVLLFLAVERGDGEDVAVRAVRKVVGLRMFADSQGRMNLSCRDVGGRFLCVSQFTLAADLKKGYRPSFGGAEDPLLAKPLFERFCELLENEGVVVQRGVFGAHMDVELVNDGPVTFWMEFPVGLQWAGSLAGPG